MASNNKNLSIQEIKNIVLGGSASDLKELIDSGEWDVAGKHDYGDIKRDFMLSKPSAESVEKLEILLDAGMKLDTVVNNISYTTGTITTSEYGTKTVFDCLVNNGMQNQAHEDFIYKREMIELCARSDSKINLTNVYGVADVKNSFDFYSVKSGRALDGFDYRDSGINGMLGYRDVELVKTFIENGYRYEDLFENPNMKIREGILRYDNATKMELKAFSDEVFKDIDYKIQHGSVEDFSKAINSLKAFNYEDMHRLILEPMDLKEDKLHVLLEKNSKPFEPYNDTYSLGSTLMYGMSESSVGSDEYNAYKNSLINLINKDSFSSMSLNTTCPESNFSFHQLLLQTGDTELIKHIISNTNIEFDRLFDRQNIRPTELYSYGYDASVLADFKILSLQKHENLSDEQISEIRTNTVYLYGVTIPLFENKISDFMERIPDDFIDKQGRYLTSIDKLEYQRDLWSSNGISFLENSLVRKFGEDSIKNVVMDVNGDMIYHLDYKDAGVQETTILGISHMEVSKIEDFSPEKVSCVFLNYSGKDAVMASKEFDKYLNENDSVAVGVYDFASRMIEKDVYVYPALGLNNLYDSIQDIKEVKESALEIALKEDEYLKNDEIRISAFLDKQDSMFLN